jgi:hypothetical protein
MRNVNANQLKTCIFITWDEFERIASDIFRAKVKPYSTYEGLELVFKDEDYDDDMTQEEINEKFAKYYDVKKVTSVHIDDCDYCGVWVAYKND